MIKEIIEELNYQDFGKIDEAGISRVFQMLKENPTFVIISAFRGNFSKSENLKRNKKLLREMRKLLNEKIGAYSLVGHWKECSEPLKDGEKLTDCKGKIIDQLEESWLIIKPYNIDEEDFKNVFQKLAYDFEQDAFLFGKNGKVYVISKDGDIWDELNGNIDKSLETGFKRIINKQGFTQLKDDKKRGNIRHIVFEGFGLKIPKDTNSSKMLFKSMNVLY